MIELLFYFFLAGFFVTILWAIVGALAKAIEDML